MELDQNLYEQALLISLLVSLAFLVILILCRYWSQKAQRYIAYITLIWVFALAYLIALGLWVFLPLPWLIGFGAFMGTMALWFGYGNPHFLRRNVS